MNRIENLFWLSFPPLTIDGIASRTSVFLPSLSPDNDPAIPNAPRDASAATIIASALDEFSTFSEIGATYKKATDKILASLTEKICVQGR